MPKYLYNSKSKINIIMKKEDATLLIGLILVVGSIISSVVFGFYFWYSFYVIGAFMFFGSLNYKLGSKSVFSYVLNRKYKPFLLIYTLGLFLALLVDIIYGRNIATLWYYPNLKGIYDFVFPLLFYYPFGGLQVYEIFYFCKTVLAKKLKDKNIYHLGKKVKTIIIDVLILFFILGLLVPLVNLLFNANRHANEIMVFIMILTVFSTDALVYKINKKSVVLEFIQGNKLIIATLALSWIIAVVLTEVPNVFSWEWIYHNVPFINFEFLKINILIFTFGWFFLVFVPVRGIDLIKLLFKLKEEKARQVRRLH